MIFCSAFGGGELWKKRKSKSPIVQYVEEGTFNKLEVEGGYVLYFLTPWVIERSAKNNPNQKE